MKKLLMPLALLALAACNGGMKTTESGLEYKIYGENSGVKPKEGDWVTLTARLVLKTKEGKDTVVYDSRQMPKPLKMPLPKASFKGSFEEGIALLCAGDSAEFMFPADSFFIALQRMPEVPAFCEKGSKATFHIALLKIESADQVRAEFEKEAAVKQQAMEQAKVQEPELIKSFLAQIGKKPMSSKDGLYIFENQAGTGVATAKGKTAVVNYVGKLVNGKLFDTCIPEEAKKGGIFDARRPYSPIKVKLGAGETIKGWDLGLVGLKKGGKYTVLVPSELAYGSNGAGNVIPPFSPLVFDIEVVDVIN